MDVISSVKSNRILYTPSQFARASLLHLQEAGSLKALKPHVSERNGLASFLCFAVLDGCGVLRYDGDAYKLSKGDCVFIDCSRMYSHSTGDSDGELYGGEQLWTLRWVHFNGISMSGVYEKYIERGGGAVFHPKSFCEICGVLEALYDLAGSDDYIRDMRINEKLSELLTLMMQESWHPENNRSAKKRMELSDVRKYIDEHYTDKIMLDDLASMFYINKYYLVKLFKSAYGMTVNAYIISKRVTRAKQLLRFTDMSMEEIGSVTGFGDANYFARAFKKVEGISPSEYRRLW